MTDRERYLALVLTQPDLRADALAVLAGEDAEPRAAYGCELARRGAAPIVLVTGRASTEGPHTSAHDTSALVMAHGLAPDRITVDAQSPHTRAQALRVIAEAKAQSWHRLLVVASAYHLPRAFLTFLQAADEAEVSATCHLVPVPVLHAPWSGCPARMTETRLALLERDLAKVETYRGLGHCASYARGVAYLQAWEGR